MLTAALATLAAVTPAAPVVEVPRAAYLVSTPAGQRLALPVGVRVRPAAGRTTVRLRATVRLPGGKNLRPTPSTRQHPTAGRIEHTVLFSPAATATLMRLARRPTVTVRAFAAEDADGDGAAERTSAPVARVGRVPRVRHAPPVPGPRGALVAADACTLVAGAPCTPVAGEAWTAEQRWAVRAWRLACPPGTAPAATAIDTPSPSFAASTVAVGEALWIEVADDQAAGHPAAYTPSVACIAPTMR